MPNALIHEKSPYLLEHAHNPVDWLPWSDAAFYRAQAEDKPVFVSIGYAACHWCHVMAHESFEDRAIAQLLNAHFISVKVDREAMPDVDAYCMVACQLMTGAGGWPLSVFMTADRRPFFAGTYFPPHDARGQTGFYELLLAIAQHWRGGRAALLDAQDRLLDATRALQQPRPGEMSSALMDRAYRDLKSGFDPKYGGFGPAPKFPTPHVPLFLMRYGALTGEQSATDMALETLRHMALGGLYDHVGGGFCRYSTDRIWLAPHFEKMLYDNALLALCQVEAFQITGDPFHARVARETLDFALREMRGPEGGFFASFDADSAGREGAYYLFSRAEVLRALGEAEGESLCRALDITDAGNFEGLSIPNRIKAGDLTPDALRGALDRLRAYRQNRMPLRMDDKRLAAWNALMVAALALAAGPLDRPDYLVAALAARQFIGRELTRPDGGLFAYWRDGAAGAGTLDDYAFLSWADVCLYDATLDAAHLDRARDTLERVQQRFSGKPGEGYFLSEAGTALPVRPREGTDNALPCGNSVLALCLVRLARHFDSDPTLCQLADDQLRFVAGVADPHPSSCAFGLSAGMAEVYPWTDITCRTESEADTSAFREYIRHRFIPNSAAIIINTPGETTYQVCTGSTCGLPVRTLSEL